MFPFWYIVSQNSGYPGPDGKEKVDQNSLGTAPTFLFSFSQRVCYENAKDVIKFCHILGRIGKFKKK
jgi:hypothetical protein